MTTVWKSLLRDLPVSVNNLADPVILQESTERKLRALAQDRHTGPVGLITKGNLSTSRWFETLALAARDLDLFVFASISGLPREIEPAGQAGRYRTLRAAREAGAKSIAYLRPIIHGVNDSPEQLTDLVTRSIDAGAHAIVSSGFRGDAEVVERTGLQDVEAPDSQFWSRTLKITSNRASDHLRETAERLGVPYWTRTLCTVAALRGQERSLNPYYLAPRFVGCDRCSLKETCAGRAQFVQPKAGSVELLRHLGFQVEVHTATERYRQCDVQRRQDCSLCCTNCPTAPASYGVPYINIRTWDGQVPTWGEMSFARFLTGGMLATDPAIPPGEDSRVRLHPRFSSSNGLSGEGSLYGVNSWMVWSEYVPWNKCLRCRYCFLSMFEDVLPPEFNVTVGVSPVRILDKEVFARNFSKRSASLVVVQ